MKPTARFTGLELSEADRELLRARGRGSHRERLTARQWRRIRTLLLLDEGMSVRATAIAVGGYPREVSRVAKRYAERGLDAALSDDPRPHPERKLDSAQEAAIVAMVCGPPPEGHARWTVRLIAEQVVKRGVVDEIGRETVRVTLASHGLKPWREKNVVRPRRR
ncbi:helix-turn-helix domain-containing protein [Sandaracinus amylolyticus]|uniref:helix-turn-helix domain-containing protein n=1 Tax=Sandaracinus amylolyticus TaxID=927083 RepID=UPI0022A792DD|nr:helix-turn-helix domain-containing protein [Sandaracinus amylolyticus]